VNSTLAIEWRQRVVPKTPDGAWLDPAAVRWLLEFSPRKDGLGELRGLATAEGIVLVGPVEVLPWAPGIVYLAAHLEGRLWLPVHAEPTLPLGWVLETFLQRMGSGSAVLCLPERRQLIALDELGPIAIDRLSQWVSERVAV